MLKSFLMSYPDIGLIDRYLNIPCASDMASLLYYNNIGIFCQFVIVLFYEFCYLYIIEFNQFQKGEITDEEEVDRIARRILIKNRRAFEKLSN